MARTPRPGQPSRPSPVPARSPDLLDLRRCVVLLLGVAPLVAVPGQALAGPDACDPPTDGVVTCRGDQSEGIVVSPAGINTLRVLELAGPIDGASGDAVVFRDGGLNVIVEAGTEQEAVVIGTSAAGARGIVAESVGRPADPPESARDPFLGVFVVGEPDVPGGRVDVRSRIDVTTRGDGAHGVAAYSGSSGYGPAVIDSLTQFDAGEFSFVVTDVFLPDGSAGTPGEEIAGVLIDADGNPLLDQDGNPVTAGTFVLDASGQYSFARGSEFDDLAMGESRQVAIDYGVQGTNDVTGATEDEPARLIVTVRRNEESGELEEIREAYFERYGVSTRPAAGQPDVFPDLGLYVEGLLGTARAGSEGGPVGVTHSGRIETLGAEAHGIRAETRGGTGGRGRNGSISRSATPGNPGKNGGRLEVSAGGEILTHGAGSSGVVATSRGGDGGRGGEGGTWRYGQRGGTGGDGGTITVSGTGTIRTDGQLGTGVLALSIGGDGGNGGSGEFVTGGGRGGYGGRGGDVTVAGDWDVTTLGEKAHGIWAKSMGGNAGSGGSGGWAAGSPGGGGQATDGGAVSVRSGGAIETSGDDAFGIHAQSVGGFGGKGGGGFSLFYSAGGDGGSAGSGGTVTVAQEEGGSITTHGERSHGILAQSVGGGGGSGGGTSGLVSLGGEGQAGGNAGLVDVNAAGEILTEGAYAYGILAQSIGGGGGDGGGSGGLAALGGTGSGGGEGGEVVVTVEATGSVETRGAGSHVVLAQSIGGGGGTGGASGGFAALGGSGSGGGMARSVSVTSAGSLSASGAGAMGIFAESVGGGGGDGGSSGGAFAVGGSGSATSDGGAVAVVNSGSVASTGAAIFAQSIGGGGGNGGSSGGWFSFGGSGGGGGDGDAVTVTNSGSLSTTEANASAILAQSVGGGGGNGGNSVAVGAFGSVAIGGDAGVGGDGGEVTVSSSAGSVSTSGDRARGIFAQSVGGGGGNGGFAFAGSVGPGVSVSVGIGGAGGAGGSASAVSVPQSRSDITTLGADSHGIFAQSVGGGGGAGGFSIALSGSDGFAGAFSIGGPGGKGGTSGRVTLGSLESPLTGTISTAGSHSYGILAQSIGGSGGDGGFSIAATVSGGVGASLSFGGVGGEGSSAEDVGLYSANVIETLGADSHGLFAQSVGGGGGSGGFGVTGGLSGAAQLGASFGGGGGDGANAGRVDLVSVGEQIATSGYHAYGIAAQSVGGSGGDGGFSVAGGIASSASVNFSMGGSGGDAGLGGSVHLTSGSSVTTRGADSHAVLAQSVGGGGGSGGFSATGGISAGSAQVGASIGGAGGDGGNADEVVLVSTGEAIGTEGDRSYGLLAQSVGGSGGSGGFSVAGGISQSASVNFALGGSGGAGGTGGVVELGSSSLVETLGEDAHGLFAQSVGGGGGAGGFAVTGGISAQSAQIGAAIGGAGGDGGVAREVSLTSDGETVHTAGARSHGLLAQSIGGSGGAGGFSVAGGISKSASVNFGLGGAGGGGSSAGPVTLTSSSSVATDGAGSVGLFAQSLGGGGGSGGFAVTGGISTQSAQVGAAIGGSGGGGSSAGKVVVKSTGESVTTSGERSYGLLAQSVGGSGGHGGFAVAGGISRSAAVNFGLGGGGGKGSSGGEVEVGSESSVATLGGGAHGLFAQSVGGGGGSGGFAVAGGVSRENAQISAGIGGSGGGGGDASRVELRSSGEGISTSGERAFGILAQSVGGGGGDGGFSLAGGTGKKASLNFAMGGSGGAAGSAGDVRVESDSAIVTAGDASHGIVAQSVGGGGGAGGFSATGSLMQGSESKQVSVSIGGSGGGGGDAGSVEARSASDIETSGLRAFGVLAQSVGGGGGDGGQSLVVNLVEEGQEQVPVPEDKDPDAPPGSDEDDEKEEPKTWSVGLAIGAGGAGGAAGDAGRVLLESEGSVVTRGTGSHALFAQSVGGGGGAGGMAATDGSGGGGDIAVGIGFSLGGAGGGGGSGNRVSVVNAGSLATLGDGAHAVVAQSVGGGGGAGGASVSSSQAANSDADVAVNLNAAIGGDGGVAGGGGHVGVTHGGSIETSGARAFGVFAQSVGGGGGDGGNSAATIEADEGDDPEPPPLPPQDGGEEEKKRTSWSVGLAIGAGGAGGAAGDGGSVTIQADGDVLTRGVASHAVFAQSVGGGGGTGGLTATEASGGGGDVSVELGFGLGGRGGGGGSAGLVRVNSEGMLTTLGEGAHGIAAQSVGGGGGSGGAAVSAGGEANDDSAVAVNLNLAIGASGGVAGDGGILVVENSGLIETSGRGAFGVLAQSVGGGGGDGGMSVATPGGGQSSFLDLAVSVGGGGGVAGAGGAVLVSSAGGVLTRGDDAHALFAQSVGGGGGSGGSSVASAAGNRALALDFGIGGGGGEGNDGGNVTVQNEGDIDTFGSDAHGVLAQSVGGGGGRGGNAGVLRHDAADAEAGGDPPGRRLALTIGGSGGGASDGGPVSLDNVGEIRTRGPGAFGVMAQSIGGGGGDGGYGGYANVGEAGTDASLDLQIAVGGGAGSSGRGGDVRIDEAGGVATAGDGAIGIFAQSVGGGGGVGGLGISGALGSVSIGGAGGAAGDGGHVEVSVGGDVTTLGSSAHGVFAQSVGGGGGVAGNVAAGFGENAQIGLGLAFGRAGGGGGNGGLVRVTTSGDICTDGDASAGIFVQSVGGGGGVAGDALGSLAFAGSVGGPGTGGRIEVSHAGNITTTGAGAPGIFAQSVGGESPTSDAAAGSTVTVTVSGEIRALGDGSAGLLLQSEGMTGGDDLVVVVNGGMVQGGNDAAGVQLLGGLDNRLTSSGVISSASGVAGTAIRATSGNEVIVNQGILIGGIDLGEGANALYNEAGASIETGDRIDLGAGNLLTNAGRLSVSGAQRTGTTVIAGDVVSTTTGVLAFDVDLGTITADRLQVEGASQLEGAVELTFSGGASARRQDYLLLTGGESVSELDLSLKFVDLPPALRAWRMDAGETGIGVSLQPDFTMQDLDLSANRSAIAAHLNAVAASSPGAAMQELLDAVIRLPTKQAVRSALQQLQPEPLLTLAPATLHSVIRFNGLMHSCRVPGGEFRFNAEGECAWAHITVRELSQDGYGDSLGFSRSGTEVTIGGQRDIADSLVGGLGFSYERSRTDVDGLARLDGDQFELGAVLKKQSGPTIIAGGLSVGRGRYDTLRRLDLVEAGSRAVGRQDLTAVSADLRISHDFLGERWYLRPLAGISATWVDFGDWRESGSGAADAQIGSRSETYVALQPALEFGGELQSAGGTLWRPFVRLGATWMLSDTTVAAEALLAGTPDGIEPFAIEHAFEDRYLDVALGVDVLRRGGVSIRLGYLGKFADGMDEHTGLVKLWWPF